MVKCFGFYGMIWYIYPASEGNTAMDAYERHQKLWTLFYPLLSPVIHPFHLDCEPIKAESPFLLIVNHVTAFDPLLIASALGKKQIYFVASDHVIRQGLAGRLVDWFAGPILRRKGASALLTVKECLRRLRAGHSVCIFAEGEQSWDGRSIPVVEGTGTLALIARVPVVTYRLEGGYLSFPRWGRGLRRGRMRGRVTGVYSPEALSAMDRETVNRLLNEGIQENAWERQKKENTRFRSRHPAEHLEKCLYLCPGCGCVGTLKSKGDRLACACGFQTRYLDTGLFEPASPFPTLAEWEDWQKEKLLSRAFPFASADGRLFSDAGVTLKRVDQENRARTVSDNAELCQFEDRLTCADRVFPLNEIWDMAMTQANRLLFSFADGYYEIRCGGRTNLRKYLEIWKQQNRIGRT